MRDRRNVYEGAKEVPGMILWGSTLSGPRVVPGRYIVKLIVGSGESATTESKEFDVHKDPRSSATPADLQAQVAFLLEGRDKLTQAHEAILRTRAIRDQVGGVAKKAEGDAFAELRTLGDKLKADVTANEEALYQTKNKSGQDPLNAQIDKLNALVSLDLAKFNRLAA